jgi:hypothetical protein
VFQLVEVAMPRALFAEIFSRMELHTGRPPSSDILALCRTEPYGNLVEGVQVVPSRSNLLVAMLAEFRRAIAAAQRYDDLRYRSAGRGAIAPADIPRRVFEELYFLDKPAPVVPDKPAEVAPRRVASVRFAGWPVRRRRGVV